MLNEKRGTPYGKTMNWIRCRLSFALFRASIRGARSSRSHPALEAIQGPIDLQLAEGHILSLTLINRIQPFFFIFLYIYIYRYRYFFYLFALLVYVRMYK